MNIESQIQGVRKIAAQAWCAGRRIGWAELPEHKEKIEEILKAHGIEKDFMVEVAPVESEIGGLQITMLPITDAGHEISERVGASR